MLHANACKSVTEDVKRAAMLPKLIAKLCQPWKEEDENQKHDAALLPG